MNKIVLSIILFFSIFNVFSQGLDVSPHDFGKMWTFERPPKEWFESKYNFKPDNAWFESVRKSALRMNNGCSASFVSPDGLIMTNHHCSRDAVLQTQLPGEDVMKNGFFSKMQEDERAVSDVYFEQLVQLKDVTQEINKAISQSKKVTEEEKLGEAFDKINKLYGENPDWSNLRLQIITYYSGLKYSLYGYKKFKNIKLVAIPEAEAAFYGGDPDNFTYPRYDMDFTFWRAYDEDGKPLNTSSNYFKFNDDDIHENELVFVVGNPGNTERYRTVDQLDWDRKYRYPVMLDLYSGILGHLQEQYDNAPDEYKLNDIFMLSNALKAYTGIQNGLMDQRLFKRKQDIETLVRSKHKGQDYWQELKAEYDKLGNASWAMILFSPAGFGVGPVINMHVWNRYEETLKTGDKNALNEIMDVMNAQDLGINDSEKQFYFKLLVDIVEKNISSDPVAYKEIFKGKTSKEYLQFMQKKSKFFDGDKWKAYLKMDYNKLMEEDDPFLQFTRKMIPLFTKANEEFNSSAEKRNMLEAKIAQEYFNYFGDDLPPDATSTLRISDGVVKGYDYNGTYAPYKTTFFGMYDRYYSFDKTSSWKLPSAWLNASPELFPKTMNFVATCDIIGGNSGSPIINQYKEVVGLIFDGNIESLPGNFIFDEKANRAVSVFSGGILAALKYVFNDENLVNELKGK